MTNHCSHNKNIARKGNRRCDDDDGCRNGKGADDKDQRNSDHDCNFEVVIATNDSKTNKDYPIIIDEGSDSVRDDGDDNNESSETAEKMVR